MAIKDVFKISRKTFFNPRAWLGYDELKTSTKVIGSLIKGAITPPKPERKESFDEAMKRLNLTEPDIIRLKESYLVYALGFAFLGICTFFSCFYFLFYLHTPAGFMIGLAVTAFIFAQAFRFHFWYFQIKNRKLGCTFEEWKRGKPDANEDAKP